MYTINLRKIGGSIMLAIPPALLHLLRLQTGMKVGIAVEGGQLVVKPHSRRRYTLDEILTQCDTKAARSQEDREWARGKAAGSELI